MECAPGLRRMAEQVQAAAERAPAFVQRDAAWRPAWSVACCLVSCAAAVRGRLRPAAIVLAMWVVGGSGTGSAEAQSIDVEGRAVPRQSYFFAFPLYHRGEYREALQQFRTAGNSGINTGAGRWVDSICYATMMGECFYRLGDLTAALEQYDAALQLMVVQRGWLKRLRLPPTMPGAMQVRPVPWGPSARNAVAGLFEDPMLMLQGNDPEVVLRQGGIAAPPEWYPVRVNEIMRCIALALKRRREILGPLAPQIPLTQQLVKELNTRHIPANHWFQVFVDVQLGIAKAAAGETDDAINLLQQAQSIGGRIDHPLSALALVELGHLALSKNELDVAQRCFFEASFPAVYFDQADMFEEALLGAAKVHTIKGQPGVFLPLATSAKWAVANKLNRATAAIMLASAEQAAYAGETAMAANLLTQVRAAMGRTDLPGVDIGARWQYLTALTAFQAGNLTVGYKSLADAQASMRVRSPRLFQVELATQLYVAKTFSARVTGGLYQELLREPTTQDWQTDPTQTLLVEMTPHLPALERWLEINLERRDVESILQVSEQIRRHKFFSQAELGGRLLSLRWVLDAPDAMLTDDVRQQRQHLLTKYPALAALSRNLAQRKADLNELPLGVDEGEPLKGLEAITKDLIRDADDAEALLHDLALRPEAATRIAPPLLSLDQIESRLQDGQALVVFVATPRSLHAVLVTSAKQYKTWQIKSPGRVRTALIGLIREIGNYDQNQVLEAERLTSETWKKAAAEIYGELFAELPAESLQELKELVIVPDSFLWYLPFELLQVQRGAEQKALIDLVAVRYAPTAGWAVPDPRPATTAGARVIVHGRLFSRETEALTAEVATQLRNQHPRGVVLRKRLPVTTRYLAPVWQQLIVIDDIELNEKEALNWSPAQIDQGKPGGAMLDWLRLPWGAPDVVALPGFHTRAENGLRGRLDGDEVMLSACALMASGTRTIVLSRWRTAGRASMEIIREFFQEVSQQRPVLAWQRSLLLARSSELDPSAEPRLKGVAAGQVPSADHPFFWAGYLMMGAW